MSLRLLGLVLASLALALTLIGCTSDEGSSPPTAKNTNGHDNTNGDNGGTNDDNNTNDDDSATASTMTQTVTTTTTAAAAQATTTTRSVTFTEFVSFAFRLQNVHFDSLVSNATLLASFKDVVKKAVASEAEAGTLPEHVVVEVLRADFGNSNAEGFLSPVRRRLENATAVDVQVEVHHPHVANDVVLENLGSGDNASQTILSRLEETAEYDQVLPGPIQIQVVHTPSRVARGQTFQIPAGNLGSGVGCQDGVAGTGFLMYSGTSVFTRFAGKPPHRDNAHHFVCVKYDGEWQYDTNEEWVSFTPTSSDVLVATVSFADDTVSGLRGTKEIYHGIAQGYLIGDLGFIADRWRGSNNDGEFTVTGSGFDPNEFTSTSTTTTVTTTTTTTTTTTITTTTTTTVFVCPVLSPSPGTTCQGNSADTVWKWMGDNSFGLGPTYHGTIRPDIDYTQVAQGTCLEFGCVSDWKYQQTGTKATLQCKDGKFEVVSPSNFQLNADHKCTWL
mmetsp:Transcript_89328/g.163774  ORF Transcript_89328/g.163774 Transcript_89328/m.163774 type:complete len:502 (-) Transcript_89328:174-1679(-)